MKSTTEECRRESYIRRSITRAEAILDAMGDDPVTAREIMIRMGFSDMNQVRPRLSELLEEGKIMELGKVYDESTKRNVTAFRRV